MMGIIFLMLLGLKFWATNIYGFNFTVEMSWGWVYMPIAMEAWYQLLKPNNQ